MWLQYDVAIFQIAIETNLLLIENINGRVISGNNEIITVVFGNCWTIL